MGYLNSISPIFKNLIMKKHLLLAIACLSFRQINAQITITNTDMPSANDTFRLSTTVDSWSIDPSLTGANYNWDFSFLTYNSQNVDTCVSVTSTPFLYQFYFNNSLIYPQWKADYALPGQGFSLMGTLTVSEVFDYYKKASTAFENVGFGANINGLPASVRKIPIEVIYPMDLHYLDTYSNYSAFELNVPGVFSYRQTKDKSGEVDGWGTVITPYGTFNALRVKIIQDISDSISFDTLGFPIVIPRPTETQYHWLAAGQDVPILQINESAGFITSIIYKDKVHTIGLNELENTNAVSVFPNPSTYQLTINSSSNILNYFITDLSGKVITNEIINKSNFVIDVSQLSSGNYLLRLVGNAFDSIHKITVTR